MINSMTSSSSDIEKVRNISSEVSKTDSDAIAIGKNIQEVYADDDYITLGPHTYRRTDLLNVLKPNDGTNPYVNAYPPAPSNRRVLGNPVPLGLASFSLSCLTLSLCNANVRGVTNVKVLISLFMFFGGAIELFAGLLCFVTGDTYAMTVFSSFGGFWISWGCINTDQFHSITGYGDDTTMFDNCVGFFLAGWTVFTFLMLMCTLKSSWGLFLLLFFLDLTFLMLCIGSFINDNNVKMAGGYFGILSSCCGWYSLYCMVVSPENSYINLNAAMMPHAPTI
ncbi:similar to Saccharomyces cerevisiae YDR384C ATO3 Plasma membrane protein, regulation pattern suggests a possible role in export of ammonia from the cell [Maudiozyma barnettii]|uniref:Similar to Saccharomyces cerevisiae YDR384C ATO3 Plasma membrane protein, regulation pattern suggests a possible role in export of ammonia from the cell n=1 Tax=Maudiozyma barnettii TaxID=61262 RepID=A0A8H2VDW0_9SACH|nr:putative ammonium permease ATO3 [Kazachstania barnettii]CAB4253737.1 similar to Saccharomyces cerevisiae YDR384C ATO3 Plasma membrane protein, regulation pattern suggests a possible role in export of ammonia from the cell [Kazachstania barnettii]CAD1781485.1 similar to Saccharomyces cerevisiae YDR384C ATO3 Plasma membrane protein, regulation pattern suggests a possible role in export of ammonia from the cell [Kazachstania barnettii]